MAVLPGIFFVYEISPFMVEVTHKKVPFMHLVAKLCAIVGGIFSLLGVADSILHRLNKLIKQLSSGRYR